MIHVSEDAQFWITVGCAVAMVVGLIGVVVPVLPGLPVCLGAVVVWALFADAGWGKWLIVGLSALWLVVGVVVKYAWPGKRMLASGVPNWSIVVGGLAGLVGFFVIPIVGLPIGFVVGVWGMEAYRLGGFKQAWPGTKEALKAVGLMMAVELLFGILIALTWITGLILA